jgi:hypothetical protein
MRGPFWGIFFLRKKLKKAKKETKIRTGRTTSLCSLFHYLVRSPLQVESRAAQQISVAVTAERQHRDGGLFDQLARFFLLGEPFYRPKQQDAPAQETRWFHTCSFLRAARLFGCVGALRHFCT